jgi:hypothetical protein
MRVKGYVEVLFVRLRGQYLIPIIRPGLRRVYRPNETPLVFLRAGHVELVVVGRRHQRGRTRRARNLVCRFGGRIRDNTRRRKRVYSDTVQGFLGAVLLQQARYESFRSQLGSHAGVALTVLRLVGRPRTLRCPTTEGRKHVPCLSLV